MIRMYLGGLSVRMVCPYRRLLDFHLSCSVSDSVPESLVSSVSGHALEGSAVGVSASCGDKLWGPSSSDLGIQFSHLVRPVGFTLGARGCCGVTGLWSGAAVSRVSALVVSGLGLTGLWWCSVVLSCAAGGQS
jgi:hypothetical protein